MDPLLNSHRQCVLMGVLFAILPILVYFGCGGGASGPSANISGRVTDGRTGESIAGATIQTTEGVEAQSLDDGRYTLFHPAGEIEMTVTADGYISPAPITFVTLEAGTTQQNFELIPEGRNLPPLSPQLILPDDGSEEIPLHATFRLSAFEDPDVDERHAATQWQISVTEVFEDNDIIVDQKSDIHLTEFSPQLVLVPGSTYFWRARFFDIADEASTWSVSRRFKTVVDGDGDGIPDEWEDQHGLDPLNPDDAELDPDGNGLTHYESYLLNPTPGRDSATTGGGICGLLAGAVYDADSEAPLAARLVTDGGVNATTLEEDGHFLLVHGAGCYSLNATADGYYPLTLTDVCIDEGDVLNEDIALKEIRDTSPSGGSSGRGCFVGGLHLT